MPAVVVALVVLAWAVISGMPFDGDGDDDALQRPATATIAEVPPSEVRDPGTVLEVPANIGDEAGDVTGTIAVQPVEPTETAPATPTPVTPGKSPTVIATTPVPPTAARPPADTRIPPPQTSASGGSQPTPVRPPTPTRSATPAPAPSGEIPEREAASVLRGFVVGRDFYQVTPECVRLNSRGYSNAGYTFEVWDSCAGGGRSRLLGRWRVDSKTREVFRQRDDGRYLRP